MAIDIIFASHNKGKYDELVENFTECGMNLIYDANMHVNENSEILIENAIQKATEAAKKYNMLALGDDSGVFIEALDYFPGVHSRRWSGTEEDDHGRNKRILSLMKDSKDRTAYLISRFALVDPAGNIYYTGRVKNEFFISDEEKGTYGFGYDNILIPKIDPTKTIGELTQEEKNKICNRGRIAKEIKDSVSFPKN